jgi:hypothetical protein
MYCFYVSYFSGKNYIKISHIFKYVKGTNKRFIFLLNIALIYELFATMAESGPRHEI